MVKIIILFLFSMNLMAIEGTVSVLEAPIFGEPDEKSKVIQYVRKGHSIFLHDAEAKQDPYEDLKYTKSPEEFEFPENDEFITKENTYLPKEESKFYKTLAKSGREAYILKEHVLIDYKDRRELDQEAIKEDHTDYRLEEPLDEDYPFIISDRGYRGLTMFSLGQPNYQAYPFRQRILDTSFSLSKELSFIYSKRAKFELNNRLYFGFQGGFHSSEQQYVLRTQTATQSNTRIYIGPYLSYDIFQNTKYVLTFYTTFHFTIFDEMEVKIKDSTSGTSESRTYLNSFNIAPNIGANFNFKKALADFDVAVGFNAKGLLPRNHTSSSAASNSAFWQSTAAEDSFVQPFRVEVSYFIGLQTIY